jgi:hypothetical protein
METPAEYFMKTKGGQRQALKMLGHPAPSDEDPLVRHFEENVNKHQPAMKRLGHPDSSATRNSKSSPDDHAP